MSTQKLSITIDNEALELLRTEAKKQKRSLSSLISLLVIKKLKKPNAGQP